MGVFFFVGLTGRKLNTHVICRCTRNLHLQWVQALLECSTPEKECETSTDVFTSKPQSNGGFSPRLYLPAEWLMSDALIPTKLTKFEVLVNIMSTWRVSKYEL